MIINLAERAHNHNWELDPVIRSLLDTDFYKLLMRSSSGSISPKPKSRFRSSTGIPPCAWATLFTSMN